MVKILNKLLNPHIIIFIVTLISGFSSVILTFLFKLNNSFFGYFSYFLSAYALTILIVKIPNIYRFFYKKLNNIKYFNKFIYEQNFRSIILLYLGFILNIIYIIYKFTIGIINNSLWLGATAIYYLILIIIKYYLLKKIKRRTSYINQVKVYRLVGIFILILTIFMGGMTTSVILGRKVINYPYFLIYAVALYTFYNLILAIINFIKYRKMINPILSSVKMISLVTACMSMFILQSALIFNFGSDAKFGLIMNSITGLVVFLIAIIISLYMIIKSSKIIKKQ